MSTQLESFNLQLRSLAKRVNEVLPASDARFIAFEQRLARLEQALGIVPRGALPATAPPAVIPAAASVRPPIVPRNARREPRVVQRAAVSVPLASAGATLASPAAPGHPGTATAPLGEPLTPAEQNEILSGIVDGLAEGVRKLQGPLGDFFREVLAMVPAATVSAPMGLPSAPVDGPSAAPTADADDHSWMATELGHAPPEIVTEVTTTSINH